MLRITLAYAAPGVEWLHAVEVPDGSTVEQAVAALQRSLPPHLRGAALQCAIYGQRVAPDTPLADGDRIEFTGPLLVDPKFARIERAKAKPLPKSHQLRRNAKVRAT